MEKEEGRVKKDAQMEAPTRRGSAGGCFHMGGNRRKCRAGALHLSVNQRRRT